MEERGVHDVGRRSVRVGYASDVRRAHHRWEAEEGEGLASVGFYAAAGGYSPVCFYGYSGKYFCTQWRIPKLIAYRPTSSTTMTDSSWDGNCLRAGFFARLAGASPYSWRCLSLLRLSFCRPKVDMKLFRVNVMRDDLGRRSRILAFSCCCGIAVWLRVPSAHCSLALMHLAVV